MVFKSAAENQIRYSKLAPRRFRSYTQLKRYQRRLRKIALAVFFAFFFFVAGISFGPTMLVPEKPAEIFIPNGKGDIIIGNISKNQATVMFRTLDTAHNNKPLATKASVSLYTDPEYKNLFRTTKPGDYAVTHIISIDGLREGTEYYARISASEAGDMKNPVTVSSWGSGNESLKFFAIGDAAPLCTSQSVAGRSSDEGVSLAGQEVKVEKDIATNEAFIEPGVPIAPTGEELSRENEGGLLHIYEVQNESYIHGRDKVQTIISWVTDKPARSWLKYREGSEGVEQEMKVRENWDTKHVIVLTTLKPDTVYYFSVRVEDETGDGVISEEYSLHTPRAREMVLDMVANNFRLMLEQVGL